jgi:hypothetical protein
MDKDTGNWCEILRICEGVQENSIKSEDRRTELGISH